ncbi:primosomal protein N' [Candidatus Parcubacteria bacterium]|nr:MAG: primosomal protein N' [Candidatus Parcubacteria bacterium]
MKTVAKIIPYVRLPKSLGVFDYKIAPHQAGAIKPGALVRINFRNKPVFGVVLSAAQNSGISKKKLLEIDEVTDLVLPPKFMQFLLWFADYYFISPALALKTMMPKPAAKKDSKKDFWPCVKSSNKMRPKAFRAKEKKILYLNSEPRNYFDLISKTIKSKKQVLVLFPEIFQVQNIYQEFLDFFKDAGLVQFHSRTPAGSLYTVWRNILTGKASIIVGTRQAVMVPLTNLGLIIINDSFNSSFKQWDQNPRYNASVLVEKLREIFDCQLVISTLTPTVEEYNQVLENKFQLYEAGGVKTESITRVINMKDEIKAGNFSVFSRELMSEMSAAAKKGEKVLILAGGKSTYSYVICRDCGYVPKCPDCGVAFSYYENQADDLICNHCRRKQIMSPFCPLCRGSRFKFVGVGLLKITADLKKFFPDAKIELIDNQKLINADAEIFLSTPAGLNRIQDCKFKTASILNFDTLINVPDYRASERSWRLIFRLKTLSSRLLIQTYNTENPVLQHPGYAFYKEEIKNRKSMGYPPFGFFIKFIYQDSHDDVAKKTAFLLFCDLKRTAVQDVTVLGPFPSYIRKIRGNYRWLVILKCGLKTRRDDIKKIMSKIDDKWLIDINPDSLL